MLVLILPEAWVANGSRGTTMYQEMMVFNFFREEEEPNDASEKGFFVPSEALPASDNVKLECNALASRVFGIGIERLKEGRKIGSLFSGFLEKKFNKRTRGLEDVFNDEKEENNNSLYPKWMKVTKFDDRTCIRDKVSGLCLPVKSVSSFASRWAKHLLESDKEENINRRGLRKEIEGQLSRYLNPLRGVKDFSNRILDKLQKEEEQLFFSPEWVIFSFSGNNYVNVPINLSYFDVIRETFWLDDCGSLLELPDWGFDIKIKPNDLVFRKFAFQLVSGIIRVVPCEKENLEQYVQLMISIFCDLVSKEILRKFQLIRICSIEAEKKAQNLAFLQVKPWMVEQIEFAISVLLEIPSVLCSMGLCAGASQGAAQRVVSSSCKEFLINNLDPSEQFNRLEFAYELFVCLVCRSKLGRFALSYCELIEMSLFHFVSKAGRYSLDIKAEWRLMCWIKSLTSHFDITGDFGTLVANKIKDTGAFGDISWDGASGSCCTSLLKNALLYGLDHGKDRFVSIAVSEMSRTLRKIRDVSVIKIDLVPKGGVDSKSSAVLLLRSMMNSILERLGSRELKELSRFQVIFSIQDDNLHLTFQFDGIRNVFRSLSHVEYPGMRTLLSRILVLVARQQFIFSIAYLDGFDFIMFQRVLKEALDGVCESFDFLILGFVFEECVINIRK